MGPQKFPIRLPFWDKLVAIRLPGSMGLNAKIYLRNIAKDQVPQIYFLSIETGISGRTNSGDEIPIDSVGRWLFGVPGYMGHIRVSNWEDRDCKVEFPKDSPEVVHQLIEKIKKLVESQ